MNHLANENPLLHVSGLRVTYADGRSFSYPDITLCKGQCLSISGPTGCGKTSLLNALFQPSFQAQVSFQEAILMGKDIRSYGKELFGIVSYMPQYTQDGLNPLLTVEKQVKAVEESNGFKLSAVELEAQMTSLNLDQRVLQKYPHQMSGGMKQRLVLLLSYMKHPALMVLDEPSSAIDALTLKVMLDFLLAIKHSGISLLLVSHDVAFTRHIADSSLKLVAG